MFSKLKTSPSIILVLAPGKREMGIAVFNGVELVYFALKTLRNCHSEKHLKNHCAELVQELIAAFEPQVITVRAISQYQKTSGRLKEVQRAVIQQAGKNKIPAVEISLARIKSELCDDEKPSQKKAFQKLVVIYPELGQFFNRPSKWQNEYYNNLLSAVSVGVVYLKALARSR